MIIKKQALAKLNLFLHITSKRPDGFHNLESLVCFAKNLFDIITIEENCEPEVIVSGKYGKNIINESLVTRVLIENKIYSRITIEKNIPVGAGLGGGSSDAATVLKHFNIDKNLLKYGADVEVCHYGKSCYMNDIGSFEKKVKIPNDLLTMIIYPGINNKTQSLYKDVKKFSKVCNIKPSKFNSKEDLFNFLEEKQNDFLNIITIKDKNFIPVVDAIKSTNPIHYNLTGSGSAFFSFYENYNKLKTAQNIIDKNGYKTFITELT